MHTLRWNFLPVSLTFLGSSEIFKGPLFIHGCYHFHAAKFCQNPNFFFSRALPALISFCPEAWGETCHRVDNSIWETHWQAMSPQCRAAVCSSRPHPPGSRCFVTTRLLFGRTGQDGTCLHWRRGRLSWLPSPAPPTAPQEFWRRRSWVSLKVRLWVKVVLMPASFPFWPPRDADAKGFQGCSPAVDADVQGKDWDTIAAQSSAGSGSK